MPKYLGPSDRIVVGDKTYLKGENVPISAAIAKHLSGQNQGGHRFEGVTPEGTAPAEKPAGS